MIDGCHSVHTCRHAVSRGNSPGWGYWAATVVWIHSTAAAPPLPPSADGVGRAAAAFDVVVVGGGVIGCSILYHLASWGVLSIEKVCRCDTSTSTKRDMLFVHMLPLLILSSTYVWPLAWGSALRADFLAPTSYLFWSATHVIQTAWLRGRRPDL